MLVNNAGISWQGLFTDMTLSDWQRVMDVNLTSMFLCCRRALGPMIRRKAGCIINISSMWGQQGAACEAAYSASKAAVIGLTQALAREEGPSGIRVNCIAPGVIDTPMNGHLSPEDMEALRDDTPLMRIGSPKEVAKAAVFLWENSFVTGQTMASFEPMLDYCVVKMPRLPFDKFISARRTLTTQMKATGEVMSLHKTISSLARMN